jgi:hypothetical protein
MTGDICEMSFDPSNDSSLSMICDELSEKLNCHPTQVHLFHLSEEEENKEKSFIPSPDELVGVFIKDPIIYLFSLRLGEYYEESLNTSYIGYLFRVEVFGNRYENLFFYHSSTKRIHPCNIFSLVKSSNKGFLPGIVKYEDIIYESFEEFVKSFKNLPNYLYDLVTEMIEDRWSIIRFENEVNHLIPSNGGMYILSM